MKNTGLIYLVYVCFRFIELSRRIEIADSPIGREIQRRKGVVESCSKEIECYNHGLIKEQHQLHHTRRGNEQNKI